MERARPVGDGMFYTFVYARSDSRPCSMKGPPGDKGDRGATGAHGVRGTQGERGAPGVHGDRGTHGVQGERGRTGKTPLPRRVLFAFVVLACANAIAIAGVVEALDRTNEGRAVAAGIVCAFGSAIAEQGRGVINQSAMAPKTAQQRRFIRNLERMGYPSLDERVEAAKLGAQAYVDGIAAKVEQQTGITGLVIKRGEKAGTLDCGRLVHVSGIDK